MLRQPKGEGTWLLSFYCLLQLPFSPMSPARKKSPRPDPSRRRPSYRDPKKTQRPRRPASDSAHPISRSFDLPREWISELRDTTRPGQADRASALVAKALQAFLEGDYRRAASLAADAKVFAQRSPRIRELLGLALYHSGDFKEALRELQAFKRMSGSLEQNHLIADSYRAVGRPEKAIEVTGEVHPKDVSEEVWTELLIVAASTLADGGDFERALSYISRGEFQPKEVQPHHLRLWYVRAELLEKAGKETQAKALWERIAREEPDFFDVSDRLEET